MNKVKSGDFLLRHALNNIWCMPDQDKRTYIKPAKLSPRDGDYIRFSYLWSTVALPTSTTSYVVYQIGQIHPKLLNLSQESFKKWIKLSEICECENILVDVFTEKGILLPRSSCYYRVSEDRNLLLAISIPNLVCGVNITSEDVYVSIYSNTHYRVNSRNTADPKALLFGGDVISKEYTASDMQREIFEAISPYASGSVVCTVNGQYVDAITPVTARIGDYADWYFDSTIFRQIDYDISSLPTYASSIDGGEKYILNHNVGVSDIEHIDDIDFYVIAKTKQRTFGVQLQQYKSASALMLTNCDYAVSVDEVNSRIKLLGELPADTKFYVRALFRKVRHARKLMHECSRIMQLNKLDYAKRKSIMSGQSGPQVWHAANLEKSDYIKLMYADYTSVDRGAVQNAYGYHALSQLLGNTPARPRMASGQLVVDVPMGLQQSCTGYEYDSNGRLVHIAFNGSDTLYRCTNKNAVWVELIFGEGGATIDLLTGTNTAAYDSKFNYRFYQKTGDAWSDVSDSSEVSINTNIWSMRAQPSECAALSNKRHLFIKRDIQIADGVLAFNLTHMVNNRLVNLPFSLGEYDVFLNGYPLIEDVDFVINFPVVYITSKNYLNLEGDKSQSIVVRGMNFCNKDMTHRAPEEVGFVVGGVLSRNSKHELREDKVLSIYCGGSFFDRSELKMDEDSPNVLIDSALEGMPYSINHLIVPMSNFLVSSTAPIDTTEIVRSKALAVDAQITSYMDSITAPGTITGASVHHVHNQYSLFFSKIINDLENKYFWDNRFSDGGYIDDGEIDHLLEYYLPLLNGDPVTNTSVSYAKYTKVDPALESRLYTLGLHQKNFLDRVVAKYGNGRIDLQGWIEIKL